MPAIPRLIPESDDGNVEYKLQLLDPSPTRFVRLVTQLKWRLLEGGGQAYYELGVADSGDLLGLSREDLEKTLQTLDEMAGEIGASVIVVKEVEVPATLSQMAWRNNSGDSGLASRTRNTSRSATMEGECGYSTPTSTLASTGTESESDSVFAMDLDEEDDLSATVVLEAAASDGENPKGAELEVPAPTRYSVDIEIASVFKLRPTRSREPHPATHSAGGKGKRGKKHRPQPPAPEGLDGTDVVEDAAHTSSSTRAQNRRAGRDKRREEKRRALEAAAAESVGDSFASGERKETLTLGPSLATLDAVAADFTVLVTMDECTIPVDGEDDVFASPVSGIAFPKFAETSTGESHLNVDPAAIGIAIAATSSSTGPGEDGSLTPRFIVEALVVRKMTLEEGFLDFGGFSLN